MALESAEALILDVVDLHEQDRIVTFLTREFGRKKGVARAARRKYSRFSGQLQPLAKVRVTWFGKPGRDLVRISSVELVRAAEPLVRDLEGILLGAYLAEHLVEFAQEDEDSDHLYRLLDSTVEALIEGVDRALAARYFETWVLKLSGIFPTPHLCPGCEREMGGRPAFFPAGGDTLLCGDCGDRPGSLRVSAAAVELLRRIRGEKLARLAAAPPGPGALEEIEEVTARVRRNFLQHELKSYGVMKKTLAGV